jgi:hypothetical protein
MKTKLIIVAIIGIIATDICMAQTTFRGTKREKEECEQLALQAGTNPRAAANAISLSEAMAYRMAMTQARADLAAQVASEISSVVTRRAEQTQTNIGGESSFALMEADNAETVERVSQIIANSRPICNNTYDRDDGRVQVYVCLEMGLDAQRQAYDALDLDEKAMEEKEFLAELAKAREEYNTGKREE